MDDNLDYIYGDDTIDIHEETFDTDFDDVNWDGDVEDDSDEEAAMLYGLI